jgi:DNA-binding transcriptional regulator YhcF (GntR family)
MKNYLKIIDIDDYSITHKYLQICNSILRAIERQEIVQDDVLPSINDLSTALEVSRNTIERAYKELKSVGAVDSIPGKGYFIANVNYNQQIKVLLLFNKLSSHKKIVYDAFVQRLGNNAAVDFYIYNNDFNFFKKLVAEKIAHYAKCVIIPHFYENTENAFEVINAIPKEKLILVDKLVKGVTGDFSAVYEDFEQDIYHALEELLPRLTKYHTLKIIFPEHGYHSKEIIAGFKNFCRQFAFDYEVISDTEHEAIQPGTAYINLMEDDLVKLIERIIAQKLKVGQNIGVISYNETPLKKIILDGITTISTDFKMLGEKAADLVLSDAKQHIPIPFKITLRNSL